MNVTEAGWKLGGTGPAGGVASPAVLAGLVGLDWLGDGDVCWLAELSGCCVPLGLADPCPAATLAGTGDGVRFSAITFGTATATAAATAAADAMVTASLRSFRRRARRVISSKVPGGGGSGCTCWLSQLSSGSRSSLPDVIASPPFHRHRSSARPRARRAPPSAASWHGTDRP